jgi:hypothetical protein
VTTLGKVVLSLLLLIVVVFWVILTAKVRYATEADGGCVVDATLVKLVIVSLWCHAWVF